MSAHLPAVIVPSGAELVVNAPECSNGRVVPGSTARAIEEIDFSQIPGIRFTPKGRTSDD